MAAPSRAFRPTRAPVRVTRCRMAAPARARPVVGRTGLACRAAPLWCAAWRQKRPAPGGIRTSKMLGARERFIPSSGRGYAQLSRSRVLVGQCIRTSRTTTQAPARGPGAMRRAMRARAALALPTVTACTRPTRGRRAADREPPVPAAPPPSLRQGPHRAARRANYSD